MLHAWNPGLLEQAVRQFTPRGLAGGVAADQRAAHLDVAGGAFVVHAVDLQPERADQNASAWLLARGRVSHAADPPAQSHRALVPAKHRGQDRQDLDRPTMNRGVMDETYIRVGGEWKYLYLAVDRHGVTIH